jgi:hypothetical protein
MRTAIELAEGASAAGRDLIRQGRPLRGQIGNPFGLGDDPRILRGGLRRRIRRASHRTRPEAPDEREITG